MVAQWPAICGLSGNYRAIALKVVDAGSQPDTVSAAARRASPEDSVCLVLKKPANRLALLSAMRWFPVGLVIPVLVLLLGARGLPINTVGQIMAVYGVVTLLLELPTGGLADSWGRRRVIVASALMLGLGLGVLALFGSAPVILLGVGVLGAARALSSGPVESWFVDSMRGADHAMIESGLARGQVAESLGLGVGSVIGGLLPRLGSELPQTGGGFLALSIPFAVASLMTIAFAIVAGLLVTDDGQRVKAPLRTTVAVAVRQAAGRSRVRRVMLVAGCLGIVLSGIELLAPNAFADLVGDPTQASGVYGLLTAAAFGVAALGAGLSTRLPGRRAKVAAVAFVIAALAVLLVSAPSLPVAAAGFLLVYLMVGLQGPVMAGLLHSRVDSSVRATMMSVESLALQAGGAMANVAVGALAAAFGLIGGFGFVAAAGLVAGFLLVRDLASASPESQ